MIAALPMYDLPWLRAETDRLWQAIRDELPDAPNALTRDRDAWDIWQSPDLLLAQTCGLPFRARLKDRVTLVASPDHRLPDCPPGHYYSQLIRRRDDTRDLAALVEGVMAYNEPLSQSGWAAPFAHLAARGLAPGRLLKTGAHLGSVAAVLDGRADFAAIDAVTLSLFARHDADAAAGLDLFDRTAPTPALPYITAPAHDAAGLAAAMARAIARLSQDDRDALCLHGIVSIPAARYTALPLPPAPKD